MWFLKSTTGTGRVMCSFQRTQCTAALKKSILIKENNQEPDITYWICKLVLQRDLLYVLGCSSPSLPDKHVNIQCQIDLVTDYTDDEMIERQTPIIDS